MARRRRRRRARLTWYEGVALTAFAGVFVISAVMLGKYFFTAEKEQNEFDELAQLVTVQQPADDAQSGSEAEEQTQTKLSVEELQAINPEAFGWINIPDTRLDYPVMHTPSDPQKYLRLSFYGAYADSGVPFLEAQCTATSSNLIIYGHNMKSGSMFHALEGYLDSSYFSAHPSITLTTADKETVYDVIAVLHFKVTDETLARYYVIQQTQEQFESYVATVRADSVYPLNTPAEWGDQLITLSTCDNVTDDGRILVIARSTAS